MMVIVELKIGLLMMKKKLLNILDDLNSRGVKFALSNVLIANGKKK